MFKVGDTVRYGRTGTVGKIVTFTEERGETFAELDSTGMYYRIDQLTAIKEEKTRVEKPRDLTRDFKEEQEKIREMQENAWRNTDQSCEGGG
ncbi:MULTISPECIES: DUF2098 domain-containing protein [Methanocorpusculum]|jgi:hypothetical protein|uniref:DUF2098 domain-containing protein n=1 Tax=Methanocorpusculum parvum TaxID=2193 RepID=A0AAX0Q6K7_9EURY|nr:MULTISPECIES: DUF2098 domain-containing protein [Methanocorpusculum]MDD2803262.1 DUF2098 domain-containing protein [Methanocorpusculum sp.]MDD3047306.1 DUF2098 domain-containing protein [Methanocorpusculum sp.]MDD4423826.1 DUF2098 domain-containing protein [Methanocorpusculum parvum]MDY3202355.1 DUF2098 domain-containing protein [Methanocorpusculum sp.]NLC90283.1 DUF2098 domain-containing protein [Methanocorpusculum parvum]